MGNITFPAATFDWGTVTHVGIFNEAGEQLAEVPLTMSTSDVRTGDTVTVDLDGEVFAVVDSGSGFHDVSGGGTGGCFTPQLTTSVGTTGTYVFNYDGGYKKEEDMSEVCQFCGEPKVREITEKKLVKCQWKTRTTYYYKCGTSKTTGTYKVKTPRVRIGKACVGFKK